jgi:hypothetical protein
MPRGDSSLARDPTHEALAFEASVLALVASAPPSPEALAASRTLAERLTRRCEGFAAEQRLAAACEGTIGALERGEIAAGPVLMYLASAAAALISALTARAAGRQVHDQPLDAARHELESFAPSAPDATSQAAPPTSPDVPLSALSRGRRSRT